MSRNPSSILQTFGMATTAERIQGESWYAIAHDAARLVHADLNIAAGVIAALSPGLRWERNIDAAYRVINRRSLDGIGVRWWDGVRKAKRILRGENPCNVLGGNKVRAFYACIVNPSNATSVCVDGHAYAIWQGERVTLKDTPTINDRLYVKIASDYVKASRKVGLLPCQLQAITWVAWRRIHGVTTGGAA